MRGEGPVSSTCADAFSRCSRARPEQEDERSKSFRKSGYFISLQPYVPKAATISNMHGYVCLRVYVCTGM